jgi:hypothetical protein
VLLAKNAANDDSVGGDGSARADTVSDGDVTAVVECLLAKAGHSWQSRGDGVAETRRRRGGDDGMAETTAWWRQRRGGDDGMAETTAWPRQQRSRCNGVAETTRRRDGYDAGDGGVLLFRAAVPSATLYSHFWLLATTGMI